MPLIRAISVVGRRTFASAAAPAEGAASLGRLVQEAGIGTALGIAVSVPMAVTFSSMKSDIGDYYAKNSK